MLLSQRTIPAKFFFKEASQRRKAPNGRVNLPLHKQKKQSIPQISTQLFSKRIILVRTSPVLAITLKPITVAAVFATKEQQFQLKQLGVVDSKNLKDDVIQDIAQEILKLPISYTILKLGNEKYNHLQNKGWSQGKMKAMLHHHAIDRLIKKLNGSAYGGIVIDQFCEPAVYKRYLQSEALKLHENTTFITKAESHSINVAAASILARARFVTAMDKLSEEAGIILPKGASSKVDKVAANYIRTHGEQQLGHVAKLHFANTNKAKKYL